MTQFPFYRLQDLIVEKFGPDKIEISVYIVSKWMNFCTKNKRWVTDHAVNTMCAAKSFEEFPVSAKEAEDIRRLLGKKSVVELFSFPEQIPPAFKEEYNQLLQINQHKN